SFNNIKSNIFYFDVSPSQKTKYYLTSMNDSRCNGSFLDTFYVNVDTTVNQSGNGGGSGGCGVNLYSKLIDFGNNEVPHYIYQLRNGNLALLGLSNKGDIGEDDIIITKMKPNCDIIWTKLYRTNKNEVGYPITIFEDTLYNLYVNGATYLNKPNTSYYFKLDSGGNVLYT